MTGELCLYEELQQTHTLGLLFRKIQEISRGSFDKSRGCSYANSTPTASLPLVRLKTYRDCIPLLVVIGLSITWKVIHIVYVEGDSCEIAELFATASSSLKSVEHALNNQAC